MVVGTVVNVAIAMVSYAGVAAMVAYINLCVLQGSQSKLMVMVM